MMSKAIKFFKAFTLKKPGKPDWIQFIPTDRVELISVKFTLIDGYIQESLMERPRAIRMMADLYASGYNDVKEPDVV